MAYLAPGEYLAFGLSADTADAWVNAASAIIDAHCKRSTLASTSFTEVLRVQRRTGAIQLTYGPVVAITAVRVRVAYRRADESMLGLCALSFGLPGQWIDINPTTVALDPNGELRFPQNFFGLPYTEAQVVYQAGFATIPDPVKIACAQIVKNAQATPGLNVKMNQLDTLRTEYFSDSLLDSQVRALLRPFVAERMC